MRAGKEGAHRETGRIDCVCTRIRRRPDRRHASPERIAIAGGRKHAFPGQEIDGHLEDWSPCSNPFDLDFVVGIVTGDRKERFPDGTLMTTSLLTTPRKDLEAGAIIET